MERLVNTLFVLLLSLVFFVVYIFVVDVQDVKTIKFAFPKEDMRQLEIKVISCEDSYCVLDYKEVEKHIKYLNNLNKKITL